jgi:oligoendopeptidase F
MRIANGDLMLYYGKHLCIIFGSGGSRFPMESLKAAGVDMSTPAPVEDACRAFARIVEELEGLLR